MYAAFAAQVLYNSRQQIGSEMTLGVAVTSEALIQSLKCVGTLHVRLLAPCTVQCSLPLEVERAGHILGTQRL